ncbi:hypothetical protein BVC80_1829g27 [Macleaya cordata]|uniref:Uncharacterized protein n=1 Tax=Macleaya cordata TaxID=56857 RepID=A0A200QZA1_MACCD|nr:hypothetical protein BVC80_1829g27 [Macleaya cordata]
MEEVDLRMKSKVEFNKLMLNVERKLIQRAKLKNFKEGDKIVNARGRANFIYKVMDEGVEVDN